MEGLRPCHHRQRPVGAAPEDSSNAGADSCLNILHHSLTARTGGRLARSWVLKADEERCGPSTVPVGHHSSGPIMVAHSAAANLNRDPDEPSGPPRSTADGSLPGRRNAGPTVSPPNQVPSRPSRRLLFKGRPIQLPWIRSAFHCYYGRARLDHEGRSWTRVGITDPPRFRDGASRALVKATRRPNIPFARTR